MSDKYLEKAKDLIARLDRTDRASESIAPSAERTIDVALYQRNRKKVFKLTPAMRERSMHVLGLAGTGKTKFLEAMIREDIIAGHGLMVIDPQGNLYNEILRWLTTTGYLDENRERFILIDPNQIDYSIGYNPLDLAQSNVDLSTHREDAITDVVGNVMNALKAVMGDENQDAMATFNKVMPMLLQTLADLGLTINEAMYLVSHKDEMRKYLTSQNLCSDLVQSFWRDMDDTTFRDFQTTFLSSENRIHKLLQSPVVKYMMAQSHNVIDFNEIMDSGKVVLVNLAPVSEGFTEKQADILGRLLINDITTKAPRRQKQFNKDPRSFYLIIDECYRFVNEDIAEGIDRLRQFGLRFVLSHQFLSQLYQADETGRLHDSITGNAQLKVYFKLQHKDAEYLVPSIFAGQIDPQKVKEVFNTPSVVEYKREQFVDESDSTTTTSADTRAGGSTSASVSGSSVATQDVGVFETGAPDVITTIDSSVEGTFDLEGHTDAISKQFGTTVRLQDVPQLMWLPTSSYTIEEQYHEFITQLISLKKRHGIVVLPELANFEIYTLDMDQAPCNDQRLQETKLRYIKAENTPYVDRAALQKMIEKRQNDLYIKMSAGVAVDEDLDKTTTQKPETPGWAKEEIRKQKKNLDE